MPAGLMSLPRPIIYGERGINENTNGLIRDFFPKGTDFHYNPSGDGGEGGALARIGDPANRLAFKRPTRSFTRWLTGLNVMHWEVESAS